jgi:hypothetical protein
MQLSCIEKGVLQAGFGGQAGFLFKKKLRHEFIVFLLASKNNFSTFFKQFENVFVINQNKPYKHHAGIQAAEMMTWKSLE